MHLHIYMCLMYLHIFIYVHLFIYIWGDFPGGSSGKESTCQRERYRWEMQVLSLGWEDSLEEKMASHSSILAWKIPWIEGTGGLQSMGSQNQTWLSNWACTHTHTHFFKIYLCYVFYIFIPIIYINICINIIYIYILYLHYLIYICYTINIILNIYYNKYAV